MKKMYLVFSAFLFLYFFGFGQTFSPVYTSSVTYPGENQVALQVEITDFDPTKKIELEVSTDSVGFRLNFSVDSARWEYGTFFGEKESKIILEPFIGVKKITLKIFLVRSEAWEGFDDIAHNRNQDMQIPIKAIANGKTIAFSEVEWRSVFVGLAQKTEEIFIEQNAWSIDLICSYDVVGFPWLLWTKEYCFLEDSVGQELLDSLIVIENKINKIVSNCETSSEYWGYGTYGKLEIPNVVNFLTQEWEKNLTKRLVTQTEKQNLEKVLLLQKRGLELQKNILTSIYTNGVHLRLYNNGERLLVDYTYYLSEKQVEKLQKQIQKNERKLLKDNFPE